MDQWSPCKAKEKHPHGKHFRSSICLRTRLDYLFIGLVCFIFIHNVCQPYLYTCVYRVSISPPSSRTTYTTPKPYAQCAFFINLVCAHLETHQFFSSFLLLSAYVCTCARADTHSAPHTGTFAQQHRSLFTVFTFRLIYIKFCSF